jgi:hypothetical protein
MDVSNDTDTNSKYKVSGGGGAPNPDTAKWLVLKAKGRAKPRPQPPGPWKIAFLVNGHEVMGEASTSADKVRLMKTNGRFHVEVCRVF